MPSVEFSSLALADLKTISRYSIRTWGADQALRYVSEIEQCAKQIAESPRIGRTSNGIKPGYRCIEQGRHVIFYRQRGEAIIASRILHQRMLPKKHWIE